MTKLLVFLFLSLNLLIPAQDKRYTHDSENGFMWQDFNKRMIMKDVKYDFLSAMLDNLKVKKLSGNYKDDLGCDKEIKELQLKEKNVLDLHLVVKKIDIFYSDSDNLIIPINYAYCYCIKELAGYNTEDLQAYREKLIKFSSSN